MLGVLHNKAQNTIKNIKVDKSFIKYFTKTILVCFMYFAFMQFVYALIMCLESKDFTSASPYVEGLIKMLHLNPDYIVAWRVGYGLLLLLPLLLLRKCNFKALVDSVKVTVKQQGIKYVIYLVALYIISQNIMVAGVLYMNLLGVPIWLTPSPETLLLQLYAHCLVDSGISKVFFIIIPFLCLVGWNMKTRKINKQ